MKAHFDMTIKNDLIFVYFNARKKRINEGTDSPQEFFYGYHYFKNKDFKVDTLEFGGKANFLANLILEVLQKTIVKIFKFQYDFSGILRMENFKKIQYSDHLIMTNTRIGHSLLPYIYYSKLRKRNTKFSVFAMGMFNSSSKNKIILKIHKFLHNLLIRNIDNLIFIGHKEYLYGINEFKKYNEKIKFLPFGIDNQFWTKRDNKKEDYLLFIGNDSNRDFKFLKHLALNMPDRKFVVVTEQKEEELENIENITLYKGSWNKGILEDSFLVNLYSKARITLIPLKNSLQPSGQSVALQSMSMMTPVIISKTDGFWDSEHFSHKKNIYFTQENTVEEWSSAINDLEENDLLYKDLTENARSLINMEFNCLAFGKKLLGIIRS